MRSVLSLLAVLAWVQSSVAAECLQSNAVYGDTDNAYRIVFRPLPPDGAATTTNLFDVITADKRKLMDGFVSWSMGFSRPTGVMTYKCPAGDKTGDEIAACTVWQGTVYAVYPDGDVDLIPADNEPAAFALLFPNLGRAIHYSNMKQAEKLTVAPWDKFTYIGCTDSP